MNGKEKRRVSPFQDQVNVLVEALSNTNSKLSNSKSSHHQEKPQPKNLKKLFKSVTRNAKPDDAEAIQLTLGRDPVWRKHQVAVMKAVSKIIRLMMVADGMTFQEMEWPELVEFFISCGIFDVINLLLRIKIPQTVTQEDASSSFGDAWESVYFHSLELVSNILGSSYICKTEQKTKPFLDQIIDNKSFLDVVVKFAMDPTRPIMTCHALHILNHCCGKHIPVARRIAKKKELFPKLCDYVHKTNSLKLVQDWVKGGVEQYEFDMMGDRPQGMLPVYHEEAFTRSSVDEMSKVEHRECAMSYAFAHHLFSLKLMAVMTIAGTSASDMISKEPSLLKPCMRWMELPINSKFAAAALKETLLIVTGLCENEAICCKLVTSYDLIELCEKGVYYSSYDHVSHYFHVTSKIAKHEGMLRHKVGAVESIVRSAAIHMYSHSHDIQVYMLSYLSHILETEGVLHMIKYFGPHHIHYYPDYYFDEARVLHTSVTELLDGYEHYAKSAFRHADTQFRQRLRDSKGLTGNSLLNQPFAESLKEEGNFYFQNRDYQRALEKYTEALIVCPPLQKNQKLIVWYNLPVTLYCNRAQCHLILGNYENAIKDCDKAVARCIGVATANNRMGNTKNNTLLRKALYRRAKALFHTGDFYRSLCDISLCVEGAPTDEIFVGFKDKVQIHHREKIGTELFQTCDMCDGGLGKKLKRCANCTALYCSRDCQLKAWDKFHKGNCQEFKAATEIENQE